MADQNPAPTVMTVLGPLPQEEVASLGPILTHEHLVCDPSKRREAVDAAAADGDAPANADVVSRGPPDAANVTTGNAAAGLTSVSARAEPPIVLENLASIRLRPFGHRGNITLSSENEAFHELRRLREEYRCRTVLDVKSVESGRDHKAAERLARRLGINIIIGTTCRAATEDGAKPADGAVDDEKNDIEIMEKELLYGIDDSEIKAGFLGEVVVSGEFRPRELRALKACAVVQRSTNAPLIVSEAEPSGHSHAILDNIEKCGGLINRTVLAHMDMYAMDLTYLRSVLDRGVFVSFDRYSLSLVCFNPDGAFPHIKTIVDCICALLKAKASLADQILLSSGVCMKLQYQKYGGFGFNILFEHLLPILRAKGLSAEQIDTIVCKNPRRLLQWWTPPPEREPPKEYLPCSICRQLFEPIEGEYFTKFTFTYCGTACLRKHRKSGFREVDNLT